MCPALCLCRVTSQERSHQTSVRKHHHLPKEKLEPTYCGYPGLLACFKMESQVEQSDEPDADDLSLRLLSVTDNSTVATFFGSEKTEIVLWVT